MKILRALSWQANLPALEVVDAKMTPFLAEEVEVHCIALGASSENLSLGSMMEYVRPMNAAYLPMPLSGISRLPTRSTSKTSMREGTPSCVVNISDRWQSMLTVNSGSSEADWSDRFVQL